MDAVIAAAVALWFFASAGYAASVGTAAIRTRTFAPELGLELHGRAAAAAGWATLVLAAALFAAGALVTFVATRA
jgi:hypothetical protein